MLDLTPFLNQWLWPLLGILGAGLVTWLVLRSQAWLNAHASFLDAQTRQKITDMEEAALNEGVQVVLAQAKAVGDGYKPTINSGIVRFGAQIAINHSSGILKDNGADPDEVAAKILARLPANPESSVGTTGATLTTVTVETSPLPPLGESK